MSIYRALNPAIILISLIFLLSFLGPYDIYGHTFPLDEEAVFCIYYKMSGDELDEQDIEDFCFQSGRPSFTAFKPSEMFMKHSLRNSKGRIKERIKTFGEDSLFTWSFKGAITSNKSKAGGSRIIYEDKGMPQPTPYINSEISKIGRRTIRELLNSFINKNSKSAEMKELDVTVSLIPETIVHRFQKRNIAHENVVLPIRYVIFHPIKLKLLNETMTIGGEVH